MKKTIFLLSLLTCFAQAAVEDSGYQTYLLKIIYPWGKETVGNTKDFFSSYKHILLVSIDQDHWDSKKPPQLSLHHYSGRVVKTYKGDWKKSQKIALFSSLDGPAPTDAKPMEGELMILFTNKIADSEIGLDTGEMLAFKPEFEPALVYFNSPKNK